jgi:uncharacterized protein (TIRG00374 family)
MGEEMEMEGRQRFQGSRLRRGIILAVSLSAGSLIVISLLTINRDTFRAISHVSPLFFVLAVFLSLGKWLWSAVRTRVLLTSTSKKIRFLDLVKITYASYFTGIITPLRAGGVTGEAFFLYEYGLEAGESVAVVGFSAVISTILLLLTFPAAIALGGKYINLSFSIRGVLFTALAFGLAFLIVVSIALLRPQLAIDAKLLEHSPSFLSRRQWYVRSLQRLGREAQGFAKSIRDILRLGPPRLFAVVLYTTFYWIFGFFAVPLALVGLGYSSFFWKAVLAQMVIQVLLPFIPTPGASVFGEVGFLYVYSSILPSTGIAGLLTLVWRFLDFYLGLLVGGTCFMIIMRDINKRPHTRELEQPGRGEGPPETEAKANGSHARPEGERESKLLL